MRKHKKWQGMQWEDPRTPEYQIRAKSVNILFIILSIILMKPPREHLDLPKRIKNENPRIYIFPKPVDF